MTTYNALCRRLTPIYGDAEARAVVRMLLDEVFSLSLTDVCCGAVEQMDDSKLTLLEQLMHRLEQAEPVQYVLGRADFGGRQFVVRPGALIPRPETWTLCQLVCDILAKRKDASLSVAGEQTHSGPAVLDIGTGSGCIAVSIALEAPDAEVSAWDISPDALSIAQENAQKLDARVHFKLQDALCPPHDVSLWDIVVSNPPYVCDNERFSMSRHVIEHEPHTALFVPDDDPLKFYRSIARYAKEALRQDGWLLFETNTQFAQATAELLSQLNFDSVRVLDDIFSKPRFVVGHKGNASA